jgi:hypothetical protein
MQTLRSLSLSVAIIAGVVATATAQTGPVIVRVTKKENTETTQKYTCSLGHVHKSGAETAQYSVDIINGGLQPVEQLRVTWAILLRDPNGGAERIVEGKRSTTLTRGQKLSFMTDEIELGQFSSGGYYSSRTKQIEVVGYYVEAVADGKVIGKDQRPFDVKGKIDKVRATPETKRHSF